MCADALRCRAEPVSQAGEVEDADGKNARFLEPQKVELETPIWSEMFGGEAFVKRTDRHVGVLPACDRLPYPTSPSGYLTGRSGVNIRPTILWPLVLESNVPITF